MSSNLPSPTPWNPEDHRGTLYTLARVELGRRLQSKIGASDIVQESLFQAHRNLNAFRGTTDAEFNGWLRTILRNQLAAVFRFCHQDKRDERLEQSLDVSLAQSSLRLEKMLAGSDPTPSCEVLLRERLLRLVAALEQLPADQREAVELKHLEQLKVKEISLRMQLPEKEVTGLLRRGLSQLRRLLQE